MEKAFLEACAEGDLPKVKELLAQGCLPNGKDHHDSAQDSQTPEETPLTISVHKGHHNVVRHLITCNVDVDEKNLYGLTALHIASERGNLEIVKSLLNAGAKIDEVGGSLSTPLILAARESHEDVVTYMIACSASVDKKDLDNRTALHYASERGNLEIVKSLLNARAKIDEVDYRSLSTPLMLAAREGHQDVVNHLITCGASADKKSLNNRTALHFASERGNLEVVKLLLNAGAKIDGVDRTKYTPLMLAACEGHQNVVIHLIACDASVDKKDLNNQTALHYASERGNLEMVKSLLNAGAKIDEVDGRRSTPLMLATRKSQKNVAIHMIACGASVDGKGLNNQTALHYSSERGNLEMVKLLLNAGAKIDEVDGSQSTPLMLAACESHKDVVTYMIACGANVNRKSLDNRTALHYASERGNLEMVKLLLNAGAKIDGVDICLPTPLMLATCTNNAAIISYMLNATKQDVSRQTVLCILAGHLPSGSTSHEVNTTKLNKCLHSECQLGREVFSCAINQKYEHAAQVLITNGIGIQGLLSTSPPMTALMWTAQEGDDTLTKQLILQGVNVNYQNPDGHTALHFAAHSGRLEIVQILLNNGAEIDLEDNHHQTPLVLSVEAKKYDVMLHLITSGADVTQLSLSKCTYSVRDFGREALSHAISCKNVDVATLLITKGVGIEGLLSTSSPMTALMWTAQEGDDSLTKQLIRQGVNISYRNLHGHTALHFAAHNGRLEVVQILLNNGAEINQEDNQHRTPLIVSVEAKKYDLMLYLITSGADVAQLAEHADRDLGREAFLYAVNHKRKDIAKVMITKGVGMEGLLSTSPPMTALLWTAQEGYDSLTKQLILQGVNINYQNHDGWTALHFASQHNHIQCGILLVEAGADVSIVNKASQTPLDLCSSEFNNAILQTLSFQTKKTVCVIGNALSGKSTLIASLKNENAWFWTRFFNRLFGVREISERTAGIEPVSLSSKRYGDVMFFDFAGQHEYHGPHEIFLESILSKGLSTVTIIMVVKATEEESAICHQLNRWLHPFAKMSLSANPVRVIVIGSHMDKVKRKVEAKEKLELCYETIKDSLRDVPMKFEDLCYFDCRQPYSSDISIVCKYLKDVPPPQYKAVHIGYSIPWVISRIRSSIIEKVISMSEFSDWITHNENNLPTNLPPAEEVCKELSSTGHFLYLPSKEGTSNGWLVLDLPSILHEVYGTLFSPSKRIVNKFGLLNCQRLSILFPTLDPSMIRDVLISLEFCIELDPSILSDGQLHLMDNSDEGHEHLFFPALVSAKPPIVFSEEYKVNHILCWQLEVRENSFLSPRLLQTIILQLAAHHVFHHKQGSKTREHFCSMWWNGIFWRSTKDADVAVQISDNAVVQVIGRSAVSPEGLCMYMSRVIQDIFGTIRTLSPHLSGTEYIIHPIDPQDLLKNPLKSPSTQMFPVEFILESRRNGGSRCVPYNAVDKIAEDKNISDVFGGFQPSVDVIERFTMSASSPPPTNRSTGSTASTNPLPTASSDPLPTMLDDPLRTTPTDPLLNTSDDPLSRPSKADSDPLQTAFSDPLKTTPTGTDPLWSRPTIREIDRLIIRFIAPDWYAVGIHLGIETSLLDIIQADHTRSVEECCRTMFTRWLACDEGTGGEPRVWRTVLKALRDAGYKDSVGDVERTLFEKK